MEKYEYPIFNEDIERMNSVQIAEWIKECRNAVRKTDNKEEYLRKVKKFTDEWYIHYEENKNTFYDKPKFKTALLSLAVPSAEVMAIINGVNQSVDVFNFQTANTHYPFITSLDNIVKEEQRIANVEYIKKATECFASKNKDNYRTLLDDLIKIHLRKKTAVQIKKLNGVNINSYKSYDELMDSIEKVKNYKTEIVQIKTTKEGKVFYNKDGLELETRYIKIGYQERFKEYGISKSVYNSFLSENYYEKDYDKKMFVNIGFLLSLPFSMLNTLLTYNGYSLDKSTKKFDEIIDRAFKIGFGRNLAIDLIDFYNFEMLEKYGTKIERGKEANNFASVTHLNSIQEEH